MTATGRIRRSTQSGHPFDVLRRSLAFLGTAALAVSLMTGVGGCGQKEKVPDIAEVLYNSDGQSDPRAGKRIENWIKQLNEGEPEDRANAARALGNIAPHAGKFAPEILQALAACLKTPHENLRLQVAVVLIKNQQVTGEVCDTLIQLLKSERTENRELAVEYIGRLGEKAVGAIPALVELLKDPGKSVAQKAEESLAKMGPAAYPAIAGVLRSENDATVQAATRLLEKAGPEVLPHLADLANNRDAEFREKVRLLVLKHGEKAVPLFVKSLESLDENVRLFGAEGLRDLGPKAAEAVPNLLKALKDTSIHVCNMAQTALAKIGKPAVQPLVVLLKDPDVFARALATESLVKIGEAAAPDLEEALKSPEDTVKVHAAAALFKIKPGLATPLPVLLAALKNSNQELRILAARTLAESTLDLKACAGELAAALQDANKDVQKYAARALQNLGSAARDALPNLVKLFASSDETVVIAALKAVGAIGKAASGAAPEVEKLLEHPSNRVQGSADDALKLIK